MKSKHQTAQKRVKKGDLAGAEERGTRSSSDRDGRIYRLAVPVLK